MSGPDELREKIAALLARGERLIELHERLSRLRANPGKVTHADLLEVQEELEASYAERREALLLLGLTPAAQNLMDEELARLRSVIVGEISADYLAHSKIGDLVAGLRALRTGEGGEQ